MEKRNIEKIIQEYLEGSEHFLVELKLSQSNSIHVHVDGDEGISIEKCIEISRHIESTLDRDLEDFSLDVSSPGLTKPLKMIRQCKKYIGKDLEIFTENQKPFKAKLIKIEGERLELEETLKKKESKTHQISFKEAVKILPVIAFK